MMKRLIAAIAAILLAGLGAVVLTSYVRGADARAMAGMQTGKVLVVTAMVPKGTSAEALDTLVEMKTLPVKAVAMGTVNSLTSIVGQVSTVDLQPGEQLLGSRFVDPTTLEDPNVVKVPPGMQQVSLAMERQRMLGGLLVPGSTVGVFVSLPDSEKQPAQTHLVLQRVLVTKVGEAAPPGGEAGAGAQTPTETVQVTLAVEAHDAEKIVFGGEHGRLWLSLQPADVSTSGTDIITPENVYE